MEADYEFMESQIKRFIDVYNGTAIGESIKNQYENGQSVDAVYEQIEDYGY